MLQIKNLHAGYGELQVLKGIDIEVRPHQIVALIGPNGAGKSTVIKALYHLADVTHGQITLNGKSIKGLQTHQLLDKRIAYVNQGRIIFGNLTVRENLEIGTDESDFEYVYKKFPVLREKQNDLAFTLSGGQRQQLALGRALMQRPQLLLMDEPSLGLSPKLQKDLFKTIDALRADGFSILIVEQNAKKAIEIADKTYLLEDGKIVLSGGKEMLKKKKIKHVYLGGHY